MLLSWEHDVIWLEEDNAGWAWSYLMSPLKSECFLWVVCRREAKRHIKPHMDESKNPCCELSLWGPYGKNLLPVSSCWEWYQADSLQGNEDLNLNCEELSSKPLSICEHLTLSPRWDHSPRWHFFQSGESLSRQFGHAMPRLKTYRY